LTHKRHEPDRKKLRFHSPDAKTAGLRHDIVSLKAALAGEGHVPVTIQRRELIAALGGTVLA
jgi:hypothetical protein